MNKIVASLGMVALGASGLSTASAQDAPPQKFWNVAATLRGFYDDNINGAPSGTNKVDSFGFELNPSLGLNWTTDQTTVTAGYAYSLRYFDKERFQTEGHDSQSHTFDLALNHNFSERYSVGVKDAFVIGQEPDLLRAQYGGLPIGPVPGNNIRNFGEILLNGSLTPLFGFELGYDNQFFDYEDDGGNASAPSLSGTLDRIEQNVHIDGTWRVLPETTAFLGYQFGWVNYTADETIGSGFGTPFLTSDDKNSRSHTVYVGLSQRFSPELSGSVKVGGRFAEFYNENPDSQSDASPYLRANLKYAYAPESYLEAGASYDLTMVNAAQARDAETANIYATLRHRIVPNLFGSLTGQLQHSTYNSQTTIDGDSYVLYTFGANLEYDFTRNLSAHVGYNYDAVNADNSADYQRNRVYIGMTARY